jgi:hypothetical protein
MNKSNQVDIAQPSTSTKQGQIHCKGRIEHIGIHFRNDGLDLSQGNDDLYYQDGKGDEDGDDDDNQGGGDSQDRYEDQHKNHDRDEHERRDGDDSDSSDDDSTPRPGHPPRSRSFESRRIMTVQTFGHTLLVGSDEDGARIGLPRSPNK